MPNTENSVITLYRRELLCQATSGGAAAVPPITKVAFGDGGRDAQGVPVPPDPAQAALSHEIGRFDVAGVSYPAPTTARYTVTLADADLAGETISEAALVDADGGVCAIKTMTGKGKDPDVAFTFEFDDEF